MVDGGQGALRLITTNRRERAQHMAEPRIVTAALIIIGNEILSGRTKDRNMGFIAEELTECGVRLMEVRVVADIQKEIVDAVNGLRARYDYVFTTGGILTSRRDPRFWGPTANPDATPVGADPAVEPTAVEAHQWEALALVAQRTQAGSPIAFTNVLEDRPSNPVLARISAGPLHPEPEGRLRGGRRARADLRGRPVARVAADPAAQRPPPMVREGVRAGDQAAARPEDLGRGRLLAGQHGPVDLAGGEPRAGIPEGPSVTARARGGGDLHRGADQVGSAAPGRRRHRASGTCDPACGDAVRPD